MKLQDIQRIPVTISVQGLKKQAVLLGRQLPFSRKPANLRQMDNELFCSAPCTVYVERELVLSAAQFDAFTANFYRHQPWLEDQGGSWSDCMLCVQVSAPDRPVLLVNGAGYGYARYVARLG